MKERPIPFSAPMVRAILEGRKTVTRRVVKPTYQSIEEREDGSLWPWREDLNRATDYWYPCPYGQVGDRLWVRETAFREPHPSEIGLTREDIPGTWDVACQAAGMILYRADLNEMQAAMAIDGRRWTPSIHMPKAWARIWLEVTAVRVERLQDISEAQAHAEGIDGEALFRAQGYAPLAFERLWDSLAKPGTRWVDNPWVWVVEFKTVCGDTR